MRGAMMMVLQVQQLAGVGRGRGAEVRGKAYWRQQPRLHSAFQAQTQLSQHLATPRRRRKLQRFSSRARRSSPSPQAPARDPLARSLGGGNLRRLPQVPRCACRRRLMPFLQSTGRRR